MTIRLSQLFEEHIKQVIYNWKTVCRRAEKDKKKGKSSPQDRNKAGPSSRAGPSTRAATSNGGLRSKTISQTDGDESSENSDDDDEVIGKKKSRGGRVRGKNAGRIAKRGITNGGITSTLSTMESLPGPSTGSSRRNPRRIASSRGNSQEEDDNEDDDDEDNDVHVDEITPSELTTNTSSSNSSSSSSEDGDSDESRGIAVEDLGNSTKIRRRNGRNRDDSEDSYKPNEKRTTGKKRGRKRKNVGRKKKEIGNSSKRIKFSTTPDETRKSTAVNGGRGNYRRKKRDSSNEDDDENHYNTFVGTDGIESNNSEDIISNKPKRGRPPSSVARARAAASASTSEHTQPTPPPRRTRQNTEESERNSPDNIQSGQLRLRAKRRILHLDTDHCYLPTNRASNRRNLQIAYESESDHENNQQQRQIKTRPRRRLHSEREEISENENDGENEDSQQSNKVSLLREKFEV